MIKYGNGALQLAMWQWLGNGMGMKRCCVGVFGSNVWPILLGACVCVDIIVCSSGGGGCKLNRFSLFLLPFLTGCHHPLTAHMSITDIDVPKGSILESDSPDPRLLNVERLQTRYGNNACQWGLTLHTYSKSYTLATIARKHGRMALVKPQRSTSIHQTRTSNRMLSFGVSASTLSKPTVTFQCFQDTNGRIQQTLVGASDVSC